MCFVIVCAGGLRAILEMIAFSHSMSTYDDDIKLSHKDKVIMRATNILTNGFLPHSFIAISTHTYVCIYICASRIILVILMYISYIHISVLALFSSLFIHSRITRLASVPIEGALAHLVQDYIPRLSDE